MHWFVLIELSIASLSEIQNARGIMDVLAEMLNALDPGNKEVSCSIQTFKLWCKWIKNILWWLRLLSTELLILLNILWHFMYDLLFSGASAGSYCWFSGAMSNIQAESGKPC